MVDDPSGLLLEQTAVGMNHDSLQTKRNKQNIMPVQLHLCLPLLEAKSNLQVTLHGTDRHHPWVYTVPSEM